jgi:hypothetical protein
MRQVTVIGPKTEARYAAFDTGETWNGSPVLAFRGFDMARLIASGDGADSNGEGLSVPYLPVDISDGEAVDVPLITVDVDGDTFGMYVPQGRIWDLAEEGEGYDETNRCRRCGEHFADPHEPHCAAAIAC